MSIVREFSDAQLFFVAFLFLSLPTFMYLYLRSEYALRTEQSPSPARRPRIADTAAVADPVWLGEPISDIGAEAAQDSPAAKTSSRTLTLLAPATQEAGQGDRMRAPGTTHGSPLAHEIIGFPWSEEPSSVSMADPVRFVARAPKRVPGNHSFEIAIEIEHLLDLQELGNGAPPENEISASFVAEIGPGSSVQLMLECLPASEDPREEDRPINIDAQYQALCWKSRPLTAIFVAHSGAPASATTVSLSLLVTAGGIKLAPADFEIIVDPPTL